jgi:hypothetical protein
MDRRVLAVDSIYEPTMNKNVWQCTCYERGLFFCMLSILQAIERKVYGGKTPFTQMAPEMVYHLTCKWLRLKHQVYGTEMKRM